MIGDVLAVGYAEVLHDEARALDAFADSLDGPFEEAVQLILIQRQADRQPSRATSPEDRGDLRLDGDEARPSSASPKQSTASLAW